MFLLKFSYFLPEVFATTCLVTLLLVYTLLTQKVNFINFKQRKYYPILVYSIWILLTFVSFFYFILLIFSEPSFYTTFGLYSNNFIYNLRILFSFLFFIYFCYLYTELRSFFFYSYEFFIILFFAFIALNFILISCTLLNLFIFIEFFSLSIYFLLASNKKSPKGLDGAIKYFILGSVSSSFLLFGFFLLYSCTGVNDLFDLALLLYNNDFYHSNFTFICATSIICLSLLFKMGAFLFFFWMVDIYDGCSYPVFIFLNSFPKLIYLIKLFQFLNVFAFFYLTLFIKFLLILTLLFGFFGALYQLKIKRFLVFTSIYNISFFSITFWNPSLYFESIFLSFIFFYLFNSMVLTIIFASLKDSNSLLPIKHISSLTNIKNQNPELNWLLILFLFISSGLPPAALFFTKFFIFFEISTQLSFGWLFFFLLISSFSFFLYLRLIRLLLLQTKSNILLKPLNLFISYLIYGCLFLNIFVIFFFDFFIAFFSSLP